MKELLLDKEKTEELLSMLPFEKISEEIQTILANKKFPLNLYIEDVSNKGYFSIISIEFNTLMGIMSAVYESVKISNFGGSIVFDTETKEYTLWMPIVFLVKYKSGGRNCIDICGVNYNFTSNIIEVTKRL